MKEKIFNQTNGNGKGWKRISSFKPQAVSMLVLGIISSLLVLLFRDNKDATAIIWLCAGIGLGLIVLNSKVVYKRKEEYRVVTVRYSEFLGLEDVCMIVRYESMIGPRVRIHLSRAARFGWQVSYMPVEIVFKKKPSIINHPRKLLKMERPA